MSDKKATNPKDVCGLTKPAMSVMPMNVLYEILAGLTEGALKYGRHNYRAAGVRSSVYFDAAMRHLAAWWEGEDIDPDSGIHHVSKAMSCLTVLRDAQMNDMVMLDDRPPLPKAWMDNAKTLFEQILARHPEPEAPHTMAQADPVLEPGESSTPHSYVVEYKSKDEGDWWDRVVRYPGSSPAAVDAIYTSLSTAYNKAEELADTYGLARVLQRIDDGEERTIKTFKQGEGQGARS